MRKIFPGFTLALRLNRNNILTKTLGYNNINNNDINDIIKNNNHNNNNNIIIIINNNNYKN